MSATVCTYCLMMWEADESPSCPKCGKPATPGFPVAHEQSFLMHRIDGLDRLTAAIEALVIMTIGNGPGEILLRQRNEK